MSDDTVEELIAVPEDIVRSIAGENGIPLEVLSKETGAQILWHPQGGEQNVLILSGSPIQVSQAKVLLWSMAEKASPAGDECGAMRDVGDNTLKPNGKAKDIGLALNPTSHGVDTSNPDAIGFPGGKHPQLLAHRKKHSGVWEEDFSWAWAYNKEEEKEPQQKTFLRSWLDKIIHPPFTDSLTNEQTDTGRESCAAEHSVDSSTSVDSMMGGIVQTTNSTPVCEISREEKAAMGSIGDGGEQCDSESHAKPNFSILVRYAPSTSQDRLDTCKAEAARIFHESGQDIRIEKARFGSSVDNIDRLGVDVVSDGAHSESLQISIGHRDFGSSVDRIDQIALGGNATSHTTSVDFGQTGLRRESSDDNDLSSSVDDLAIKTSTNTDELHSESPSTSKSSRKFKNRRENSRSSRYHSNPEFFSTISSHLESHTEASTYTHEEFSSSVDDLRDTVLPEMAEGSSVDKLSEPEEENTAHDRARWDQQVDQERQTDIIPQNNKLQKETPTQTLALVGLSLAVNQIQSPIATGLGTSVDAQASTTAVGDPLVTTGGKLTENINIEKISQVECASESQNGLSSVDSSTYQISQKLTEFDQNKKTEIKLQVNMKSVNTKTDAMNNQSLPPAFREPNCPEISYSLSTTKGCPWFIDPKTGKIYYDCSQDKVTNTKQQHHFIKLLYDPRPKPLHIEDYDITSRFSHAKERPAVFTRKKALLARRSTRYITSCERATKFLRRQSTAYININQATNDTIEQTPPPAKSETKEMILVIELCDENPTVVDSETEVTEEQVEEEKIFVEKMEESVLQQEQPDIIAVGDENIEPKQDERDGELNDVGEAGETESCDESKIDAEDDKEAEVKQPELNDTPHEVDPETENLDKKGEEEIFVETMEKSVLLAGEAGVIEINKEDLKYEDEDVAEVFENNTTDDPTILERPESREALDDEFIKPVLEANKPDTDDVLEATGYPDPDFKDSFQETDDVDFGMKEHSCQEHPDTSKDVEESDFNGEEVPDVLDDPDIVSNRPNSPEALDDEIINRLLLSHTTRDQQQAVEADIPIKSLREVGDGQESVREYDLDENPRLIDSEVDATKHGTEEDIVVEKMEKSSLQQEEPGTIVFGDENIKSTQGVRDEEQSASEQLSTQKKKEDSKDDKETGVKQPELSDTPHIVDPETDDLNEKVEECVRESDLCENPNVVESEAEDTEGLVEEEEIFVEKMEKSVLQEPSDTIALGDEDIESTQRERSGEHSELDPVPVHQEEGKDSKDVEEDDECVDVKQPALSDTPHVVNPETEDLNEKGEDAIIVEKMEKSVLLAEESSVIDINKEDVQEADQQEDEEVTEIFENNLKDDPTILERPDSREAFDDEFIKPILEANKLEIDEHKEVTEHEDPDFKESFQDTDDVDFGMKEHSCQEHPDTRKDMEESDFNGDEEPDVLDDPDIVSNRPNSPEALDDETVKLLLVSTKSSEEQQPAVAEDIANEGIRESGEVEECVRESDLCENPNVVESEAEDTEGQVEEEEIFVEKMEKSVLQEPSDTIALGDEDIESTQGERSGEHSELDPVPVHQEEGKDSKDVEEDDECVDVKQPALSDTPHVVNPETEDLNEKGEDAIIVEKMEKSVLLAEESSVIDINKKDDQEADQQENEEVTEIFENNLTDDPTILERPDSREAFDDEFIKPILEANKLEIDEHKEVTEHEDPDFKESFQDTDDVDFGMKEHSCQEYPHTRKDMEEFDFNGDEVPDVLDDPDIVSNRPNSPEALDDEIVQSLLVSSKPQDNQQLTTDDISNENIYEIAENELGVGESDRAENPRVMDGETEVTEGPDEEKEIFVEKMEKSLLQQEHSDVIDCDDKNTRTTKDDKDGNLEEEVEQMESCDEPTIDVVDDKKHDVEQTELSDTPHVVDSEIDDLIEEGEEAIIVEKMEKSLLLAEEAGVIDIIKEDAQEQDQLEDTEVAEVLENNTADDPTILERPDSREAFDDDFIKPILEANKPKTEEFNEETEHVDPDFKESFQETDDVDFGMKEHSCQEHPDTRNEVEESDLNGDKVPEVLDDPDIVSNRPNSPEALDDEFVQPLLVSSKPPDHQQPTIADGFSSQGLNEFGEGEEMKECVRKSDLDENLRVVDSETDVTVEQSEQEKIFVENLEKSALQQEQLDVNAMGEENIEIEEVEKDGGLKEVDGLREGVMESCYEATYDVVDGEESQGKQSELSDTQHDPETEVLSSEGEEAIFVEKMEKSVLLAEEAGEIEVNEGIAHESDQLEDEETKEVFECNTADDPTILERPDSREAFDDEFIKPILEANQSDTGDIQKGTEHQDPDFKDSFQEADDVDLGMKEHSCQEHPDTSKDMEESDFNGDEVPDVLDDPDIVSNRPNSPEALDNETIQEQAAEADDMSSERRNEIGEDKRDVVESDQTENPMAVDDEREVGKEQVEEEEIFVEKMEKSVLQQEQSKIVALSDDDIESRQEERHDELKDVETDVETKFCNDSTIDTSNDTKIIDIPGSRKEGDDKINKPDDIDDTFKHIDIEQSQKERYFKDSSNEKDAVDAGVKEQQLEYTEYVQESKLSGDSVHDAIDDHNTINIPVSQDALDKDKAQSTSEPLSAQLEEEKDSKDKKDDDEESEVKQPELSDTSQVVDPETEDVSEELEEAIAVETMEKTILLANEVSAIELNKEDVQEPDQYENEEVTKVFENNTTDDPMILDRPDSREAFNDEFIKPIFEANKLNTNDIQEGSGLQDSNFKDSFQDTDDVDFGRKEHSCQDHTDNRKDVVDSASNEDEVSDVLDDPDIVSNRPNSPEALDDETIQPLLFSIKPPDQEQLVIADDTSNESLSGIVESEECCIESDLDENHTFTDIQTVVTIAEEISEEEKTFVEKMEESVLQQERSDIALAEENIQVPTEEKDRELKHVETEFDEDTEACVESTIVSEDDPAILDRPESREAVDDEMIKPVGSEMTFKSIDIEERGEERDFKDSFDERDDVDLGVKEPHVKDTENVPEEHVCGDSVPDALDDPSIIDRPVSPEAEDGVQSVSPVSSQQEKKEDSKDVKKDGEAMDVKQPELSDTQHVVDPEEEEEALFVDNMEKSVLLHEETSVIDINNEGTKKHNQLEDEETAEAFENITTDDPTILERPDSREAFDDEFIKPILEDSKPDACDIKEATEYEDPNFNDSFQDTNDVDFGMKEQVEDTENIQASHVADDSAPETIDDSTTIDRPLSPDAEYEKQLVADLVSVLLEEEEDSKDRKEICVKLPELCDTPAIVDPETKDYSENTETVIPAEKTSVIAKKYDEVAKTFENKVTDESTILERPDSMGAFDDKFIKLIRESNKLQTEEYQDFKESIQDTDDANFGMEEQHFEDAQKAQESESTEAISDSTIPDRPEAENHEQSASDTLTLLQKDEEDIKDVKEDDEETDIKQPELGGIPHVVDPETEEVSEEGEEAIIVEKMEKSVLLVEEANIIGTSEEEANEPGCYREEAVIDNCFCKNHSTTDESIENMAVWEIIYVDRMEKFLILPEPAVIIAFTIIEVGINEKEQDWGWNQKTYNNTAIDSVDYPTILNKSESREPVDDGMTTLVDTEDTLKTSDMDNKAQQGRCLEYSFDEKNDVDNGVKEQHVKDAENVPESETIGVSVSKVLESHAIINRPVAEEVEDKRHSLLHISVSTQQMDREGLQTTSDGDESIANQSKQRDEPKQCAASIDQGLPHRLEVLESFTEGRDVLDQEIPADDEMLNEEETEVHCMVSALSRRMSCQVEHRHNMADVMDEVNTIVDKVNTGLREGTLAAPTVIAELSRITQLRPHSNIEEETEGGMPSSSDEVSLNGSQAGLNHIEQQIFDLLDEIISLLGAVTSPRSCIVEETEEWKEETPTTTDQDSQHEATAKSHVAALTDRKPVDETNKDGDGEVLGANVNVAIRASHQEEAHDTEHTKEADYPMKEPNSEQTFTDNIISTTEQPYTEADPDEQDESILFKLQTVYYVEKDEQQPLLAESPKADTDVLHSNESIGTDEEIPIPEEKDMSNNQTLNGDGGKSSQRIEESIPTIDTEPWYKHDIKVQDQDETVLIDAEAKHATNVADDKDKDETDVIDAEDKHETDVIVVEDKNETDAIGVEEKHDTDVVDVEDKLDTGVIDVKDKHDTDISDVEDKYVTDGIDVKDKHETYEIDVKDKPQETDVIDVEDKNETDKNDVEDKHETDVINNGDKHETNVIENEDKRETDVINVEDKHESDGIDVEDKHETDEIDVKDKPHETDVIDVEDKNETDEKDVEDKHETEVVDIENKHETNEIDFEDKHDTDVVDVEDKHDTDVVDAEVKHETNEIDFEDKHETDVVDVEDKHDTDVVDVEDKHETNEIDFEDKHDTDVVDVEDKHDTDVVDAEDKHETNEIDFEDKHDTDVVDVEDKHVTDVVDVEDKHDIDVVDFEDKHDTDVVDVEDEHESDVIDVEDKHKTDIIDFKEAHQTDVNDITEKQDKQVIDILDVEDALEIQATDTEEKKREIIKETSERQEEEYGGKDEGESYVDDYADEDDEEEKDQNKDEDEDNSEIDEKEEENIKENLHQLLQLQQQLLVGEKQESEQMTSETGEDDVVIQRVSEIDLTSLRMYRFDESTSPPVDEPRTFFGTKSHTIQSEHHILHKIETPFLQHTERREEQTPGRSVEQKTIKVESRISKATPVNVSLNAAGSDDGDGDDAHGSDSDLSNGKNLSKSQKRRLRKLKGKGMKKQNDASGDNGSPDRQHEVIPQTHHLQHNVATSIHCTTSAHSIETHQFKSTLETSGHVLTQNKSSTKTSSKKDKESAKKEKTESTKGRGRDSCKRENKNHSTACLQQQHSQTDHQLPSITIGVETEAIEQASAPVPPLLVVSSEDLMTSATPTIAVACDDDPCGPIVQGSIHRPEPQQLDVDLLTPHGSRRSRSKSQGRSKSRTRSKSPMAPNLRKARGEPPRQHSRKHNIVTSGGSNRS